MIVKNFFNYPAFLNRLVIKAIICFVSIFSFSSFQGQKEYNEATLKARFIYNFTKYVEWPNERYLAHFVIGIYGTSDVAEALKQVCANRKIREKDIEIRIINNPEDIRKCDILFIPKNQCTNLKKILEFVEDKEVLVITEEKGMALKGASINIIEIEEKMRFELNESAIKRAGLKVSGQLITLAILVKDQKT